jgi:hypothetical protein
VTWSYAEFFTPSGTSTAAVGLVAVTVFASFVVGAIWLLDGFLRGASRGWREQPRG